MTMEIIPNEGALGAEVRGLAPAKRSGTPT